MRTTAAMDMPFGAFGPSRLPSEEPAAEFPAWDATSRREIETRAMRATVAAYFEAARVSLPMLILLDFVLLWFCWREHHDPSILAWGAVYGLIPLMRAVIAHRYRLEARGGPVDPWYWRKAALYPMVLTSCAYAASFWILMRDDAPVTNAVVSFYFLLLISATTNHMIGHRGAMAAFTMVGGLGLALRLAFIPGDEYKFFAFAVVTYTVIQLTVALRAHQLQSTAVRGAIANKMLVSRLSEQVSIASQATQEAVRANVEKSRFLAAATHDLRQPLHALALSATSLSLRLRGGELHDKVQGVMQSLDALEQSLNGMLDLSKLDAGSHLVKPEVVPVAEVFQGLYRTFRDRAAAKGLDLRFRPSDLHVYTDPQMLTRLIANLIDNAIKYTPSGAIHVSAKPVRPDNGMLVIAVRDSGVGIPQEYQSQIFEEFFQVNNPGRQRSQGMGLGLSIVRRLADLLNVSVRVHSRPGRGSRFEVFCRAVDEADGVAAQESRPAPLPDLLIEPETVPVRGRRILVVDNEVDILRAVRDVLESAGASVELATSADQARGKLEDRGPFDIAVLDYRLGGDERGTELAVSLRELQREELRILLVTGDTSSEEIRTLQASGVNVLFKPLRGDHLLSAIARVLEGRQAA